MQVRGGKGFTKNTQICKGCNKSFHFWRKTPYCTKECRELNKPLKLVKECKGCGIIFEVMPSGDGRLYCSQNCCLDHQGRGKTPILNCLYCNTEFRRKPGMIRENGHNFCSCICSGKYFTGENNPGWTDYKNMSRTTDKLIKWSKQVKIRDNYICQLCGCENRKELDSHHIKERNKFPELSYDINNGITLCIQCHANQHKDKPGLYNFILSRYIKLKNYAKN